MEAPGSDFTGLLAGVAIVVLCEPMAGGRATGRLRLMDMMQLRAVLGQVVPGDGDQPTHVICSTRVWGRGHLQEVICTACWRKGTRR